MTHRLKPIFSWVGVVLSAIAAATAFIGFFGSNEWLSTIGFGVAALACFKASEFLTDKENRN